MKGLTKYADKQKKRMTLTQDPDKGKKAKLAKFYKKYGFEKNRGRSRDFTTRDTDIRNPQPTMRATDKPKRTQIAPKKR